MSQVRSKLDAYIDAVSQTRDQITITKNGAPAAVLIGFDEWESIQDTLHWLSQPPVASWIVESEADIATGRVYGEDEIRTAYHLPRRLR